MWCIQCLITSCLAASLHCRAFLQLSPNHRSQIVDILAANLRYLCASAQQLLADSDASNAEALQQHRNGLKMMVHLLHTVATQASKDAGQAQGLENAAAKPLKAAGKAGSSAQAVNRKTCQGKSILLS